MRTIWIAGLLILGGGILFGAPAQEAPPLPSFATFLESQKSLTLPDFQARYVRPAGDPAPLGLDFSRVEYLDRIEKRIKPRPEAQPLTDAEKKALSDQGVVIFDSRAFPSFGDAFYDVFANDQPLFITTDSLLHAFHKSFDQLLMDLEAGYLSPLLADILQSTAEVIGRIRGELGRDPVVSEAADDVEFLLDVGHALLRGDDWSDKPRIREILQAAASEKALKVKFLGRVRPVDFSQFRPRGHYTKSEELKRYFRAMMWLGREDLSFRISEAYREVVGAFLLTDALKRGGAMAKWEEFDRMIGFLVGQPDGANPRDLATLMGRLGYGDFADFVRRSTPADTLARLGEESIGEQKILSAIACKDRTDPRPYGLPKMAQLMGQRFTLDSFFFNQLTFDRATSSTKRKRMMPQPLDIPACLGSARALELLQPDLAEYGHQASLAASIEYARAVPAAFWEQNVYHGWLSMLRELTAESDSKHPPLMKTRAWADLKLQTQLASWAQLRHDTILYAKQSYSLGIGCEYCDVYVEPYPAFYERLAGLCGRTASLLKEPSGATRLIAGMIKQYQAHFTQFATVAGQLRAVSEKELAGAAMSPAEHAFLREVMQVKTSRGCTVTYFLSGWYPKLFPNPMTSMEWDPTVADVHTQPTDENENPVGRVLHVGVGNVNLAAFAVKGHDGKTRGYLGPVFSYYEVIESNYNRLTDDVWKKRLGCPRPRLEAPGFKRVPASGPAPERPAWTRNLVSPAPYVEPKAEPVRIPR